MSWTSPIFGSPSSFITPWIQGGRELIIVPQLGLQSYFFIQAITRSGNQVCTLNTFQISTLPFASWDTYSTLFWSIFGAWYLDVQPSVCHTLTFKTQHPGEEDFWLVTPFQSSNPEHSTDCAIWGVASVQPGPWRIFKDRFFFRPLWLRLVWLRDLRYLSGCFRLWSDCRWRETFAPRFYHYCWFEFTDGHPQQSLSSAAVALGISPQGSCYSGRSHW